ncbi:hypothetical protein Tco_1178385 [Tanacetum coccineum]
MNEFPQLDSGIAVPMFTQGDDPIACLNKAMAFLSAVVALRFCSTNNQLITSSNLRNEATIQDGRVTLQQVQGRQGQSYAGICYKGNATSFREIIQEGRYGYIKNYKNTVKNGQARTRESEEYKKKPKIQSRSQKSQTRSQI